MQKRNDGRTFDQLRPIHFLTDFQRNAAASVLVESGGTRVLCAVSMENKVPPWMKNKNDGGWVTSEYRMLPGSTGQRKARASSRGVLDGRAQEIQRLIGRALRSVVLLDCIGPRTFYLDCDVIDADGGTRCAAINGAAVALQLLFQRLLKAGELTEWPMRQGIAAISVGMVENQALLDLCYQEDSRAEVDMNVVMTADHQFVELQGTAEGMPFSQNQLAAMLKLAEKGISEILLAQEQILN